ncbi:oligosaccharide flippase family protein [Microvirga aerophila]|uniref:oligosaccharide flippase family protein n=1 Tax=Microvirga aerophila TaxID=670291 RepID=UPI0011BF95C3|nr:oligosaccharide flippase family protein [Microvirga aerophila]
MVNTSGFEQRKGYMARSFLRDSLFSTAGGMSASLADLASGIVIARALGASGAGTVALAVWIALVISRLVNLGLPLALSRYLPELRASNEAEQASGLAASILQGCSLLSLIILILGLVSISTGYVLDTAWSGADLESTYWILIILLAAVQGVANPFLGYLNGMQYFKYFGIVLFLSSVIRLGSIIIGAIFFGVTGALTGNILGFALPAVLALFPMSKRIVLNTKLKQRVLRFSCYAWSSHLIETLVWSRAEIFFLARYWGADAVGLYSVGTSIANAAILLPTFMANPLLPYFGEQLGAKAFDELRATYNSATKLIALMVLPACFGGAAICPIVIPLIYGKDFAPAVPAAMIIVTSAAVSLIANPAAKLIFAMERGSVFIFSNMIGGGLLLISGILAVPHTGLLGASLIRAASHSVVVGIELWYVNRFIGYPIPVGALFRVMLASALSATGAYLCVSALSSPMSLAIAIPLGATIYVILLRYLRVLDQRDKELLIAAIQRAPTLVQVRLEKILNYVVDAK